MSRLSISRLIQDEITLHFLRLVIIGRRVGHECKSTVVAMRRYTLHCAPSTLITSPLM